MSDEIDQSIVQDPQDCLYANLNQTLRAVQPRYAAALKPHRLTPSQFTVLARLAGHGECQLTALAIHMGIDRTTLTRNLGPLIQRGLINNSISADDRRVRLISLTDTGRIVLCAALGSWRQAQQGLVDALGPELAAALLDQLRVVSKPYPTEE